MIVPDVNLLVYAHNDGFPQHYEARLWWEQTLNAGDRPIGLPWVVILGFIRVSTGRTMTKPMPAVVATRTVQNWLAQPSVSIIAPGERHPEILFNLLDELGVAGTLTTDAHLAALAIEYRAEVATADADFSRFRGLHWFNPLARMKRR